MRSRKRTLRPAIATAHWPTLAGGAALDQNSNTRTV